MINNMNIANQHKTKLFYTNIKNSIIQLCNLYKLNLYPANISIFIDHQKTYYII